MMTHVYTKIDGADACWFKGIKCALQSTGGGQLRSRRVGTRRGIEVWSRDPARLAHYFDALLALHRLDGHDMKGGA